MTADDIADLGTRRDLQAIPDTAFPDSMGSDERMVRQALFVAWAEGVEAFRTALLIAADWFEERGHPDSAVCRAAWQPTMNKQPDPKRWWRFAVILPDGSPAREWPIKAASLKGRKHNRRLWLCWPPGWVRFTGGYLGGFDGGPNAAGFRGHLGADGEFGSTMGGSRIALRNDGWTVCIGPHGTKYGTPVENRLGRLGYTALFHHPDAASGQPAAVPKVTPGLFDGEE